MTKPEPEPAGAPRCSTAMCTTAGRTRFTASTTAWEYASRSRASGCERSLIPPRWGWAGSFQLVGQLHEGFREPVQRLGPALVPERAVGVERLVGASELH